MDLVGFGAEFAPIRSGGVNLQDFGSEDRNTEARWMHDGANAYAEVM
jgi:hypothetical protein